MGLRGFNMRRSPGRFCTLTLFVRISMCVCNNLFDHVTNYQTSNNTHASSTLLTNFTKVRQHYFHKLDLAALTFFLFLLLFSINTCLSFCVVRCFHFLLYCSSTSSIYLTKLLNDIQKLWCLAVAPSLV